jgi:predicted Fe-S protein YdhL (DUF1289 family)
MCAVGIIYDMSSSQHRPQDPNMDRNRYPSSPCNSICTLDDNNRCLGCQRTLDEITRWTLMSKDEQWVIIDILTVRRKV